MRSSLFNMLDAINGRSSIAEWIDSAPRSELVEIDLAADRYRTTNNIKDKFVSAPEEGAFTELYQTTLDELIHPDDYDEYRRFMDPATLAERINDPSKGTVLVSVIDSLGEGDAEAESDGEGEALGGSMSSSTAARMASKSGSAYQYPFFPCE